MPRVPVAHVALGSNLGDRLGALRSAVQALGAYGSVIARSSVWETAAEGPPPDYLNAAVALDTALAPEALLDALLEIERRHGRVRPEGESAAPRTLDLDLLLYGDVVADTPRLSLPHPRLHLRAFVLAPLSEIAGDVLHPLLHRSIKALFSSLAPMSGTSSVRRLDDPL